MLENCDFRENRPNKALLCIVAIRPLCTDWVCWHSRLHSGTYRWVRWQWCV